MNKYNLRVIFVLIGFLIYLQWGYSTGGRASIGVTITNGPGHRTDSMGVAVGATDCIDAFLHEAELPPPPPAGIFDSRFIETGCTPPIQGLAIDYHGGSTTQDTTGTFTMSIQKDTALPILLTLSPGWSRIFSSLEIYDSPSGGVNTLDVIMSTNPERDTLTLGYVITAHGVTSYHDVTQPAILYTVGPIGSLQAVDTITASAGLHGTILPSGMVPVILDSTQSFSFVPDAGYQVDSVIVDSTLIAASAGYTFSDVTGDHAIRVTFRHVATPPSGKALIGVTITNGSVHVTDSMGVAFGATDCLDSLLGEKELPPPPPVGIFDVRFLERSCLPWLQGLAIDYHAASATQDTAGDNFEMSIAKDTTTPVLLRLSPGWPTVFDSLVIVDEVTGGFLLNVNMLDSGVERDTLTLQYVNPRHVLTDVTDILFQWRARVPGKPVGGPADTIRVVAGNVKQFVGDTVLVPISVVFPVGVQAHAAQMSFGGFQHSGLTFEGVDTSGSMMGAQGWLLQYNKTDSLLITAAAGAQGITGSGTLFFLRFAVSGSGCGNAPILVTGLLFDTGFVPATGAAGSVSISVVPSYGDVDLNGQIQAEDASFILQYLDSLITLDCQQLANADVTNDGTVSALDARSILSYVTGLITSFPDSSSAHLSGNAVVQSFSQPSAAGGIITVPIVLTGVKQLAAVQGEFTFDSSKFSLQGISNGSLLDSFQSSVRNQVFKGERIKFSGYAMTAANQSGTLLNLKFKMKSAAGDTLPVGILTLRINESRNSLTVPLSIVVVTGVRNSLASIPKAYALAQNYPNPFNPTSIIQYDLPKESFVRLSIYNILGQEVRTLVNETEQAGYRSVTFDGSNLPSGMYFYKLTAGAFNDVKKMVLLK